MKNLIMGLMCLALAACKISENTPSPTPPDVEGKLVYVGNFKTENLDFVSLATQIPERDMRLNVASQTLTSKTQACEKTFTLSNEETATLLNTLKQIRLCNYEFNADISCPAVSPFVLPIVTNVLFSYHHGDIDPSYLAMHVPGICNSYGVCSSYDVDSTFEAFDSYQNQLSCP